MKQQLLEKKELLNGFTYRFEGNDNIIDLISEFVKTEKLCCEFFDFTITVTNNNVLWLQISGPEGTKKFITTELEL